MYNLVDSPLDKRVLYSVYSNLRTTVRQFISGRCDLIIFGWFSVFEVLYILRFSQSHVTVDTYLDFLVLCGYSVPELHL